MAKRIKIRNDDKLLFCKVAKSRGLPAAGVHRAALQGACLVHIGLMLGDLGKLVWAVLCKSLVIC